MKKIILFFLFISSYCCVSGQDSLFFRNGDTTLGKVLEISDKRILYKTQEGEQYKLFDIKRKLLFKVKYPNQYEDVFGKLKKNMPPGRNMISLNIVDLFIKNLGISYQYFFKNGKWSIALPITLGLTEKNQYYLIYLEDKDVNKNLAHNKIRVGVEVNYFPTGQGEAKYYTGIGINYGLINYRLVNQFGSSIDNEWAATGYTNLYLINGVILKTANRVYISTFVTTGVSFFSYINSKSITNPFIISVGFNIGYRFNYRKQPD